MKKFRPQTPLLKSAENLKSVHGWDAIRLKHGKNIDYRKIGLNGIFQRGQRARSTTKSFGSKKCISSPFRQKKKNSKSSRPEKKPTPDLLLKLWETNARDGKIFESAQKRSKSTISKKICVNGVKNECFETRSNSENIGNEVLGPETTPPEIGRKSDLRPRLLGNWSGCRIIRVLRKCTLSLHGQVFFFWIVPKQVKNSDFRKIALKSVFNAGLPLH